MKSERGGHCNLDHSHLPFGDKLAVISLTPSFLSLFLGDSLWEIFDFPPGRQLSWPLPKIVSPRPLSFLSLSTRRLLLSLSIVSGYLGSFILSSFSITTRE